MESLYFLVRYSDAWTRYHENFFNANGGFVWGFVGALIIGIIVASVFYFGCCNSNKTSKYATISVWAIFLVVASVIGYFYADCVKIGNGDEESVFYKYSFYKANEDFCTKNVEGYDISQEMIDSYRNEQLRIADDLDKGKDVRFEYDITTAILTLLIFFIVSIIVKRLTINGKTIPFLKP